jgi:hypothetical protein
VLGLDEGSHRIGDGVEGASHGSIVAHDLEPWSRYCPWSGAAN